MTYDRIISFMSFVIVTLARWEHAFLLEWLLYHQIIGFDHVYIYDNGDPAHEQPHEDHIRPFLDKINLGHFVTFIAFPGERMQPHAYNHWLVTYAPMYRNPSSYAAFIDVDEYIVVPRDPSLREFARRCLYNVESPLHGQHVAMPWAMFGTSGIWTLDPRQPMIRQLVRRAKYPENKIKTFLNIQLFLDTHGPYVECIHNIQGISYLSDGHVIRGSCMDTSVPNPPAYFNFNVDHRVFALDIYIHHYFSRDERSMITKTFSLRTCGCSEQTRRYHMYAHMYKMRASYSHIIDDRLSQKYGDVLHRLMHQTGYFQQFAPADTAHDEKHQHAPPPSPIVLDSVANVVLRHACLRQYWHFARTSPAELTHQEYINMKYLEFVQTNIASEQIFEKQKKMCPYI